MTVVADVYEFINGFADFNTQADWDNSGLQVGAMNREVTGVLLGLDLDDVLVEQAIESGVNTIITHHPLFFSGVKSIDVDDYKGELIEKLIKHDINVIAAHTNLDLSSIGVNYKLATDLGVEDIVPFTTDGELDFGVHGRVEISSVERLVERIEASLHLPKGYIRLYGRPRESVERIALCGGSGVELIEEIKSQGVDVLITGDVKYHDGQYAYENGILLLDIGHFFSERPVLTQLHDLLSKEFPSLNIKIRNTSEFIII